MPPHDLGCVDRERPRAHTPAITLGIDVSKWQGEIDWQKVADETDYVFAFIKATENVGHVDPKFRENWRGAKDAGFLCGPYHFARVDKRPRRATHEEDAVREADHFYRILRANDYAASDLHPVLDIESHGIGKTKPEVVVAWVTEFLWRMRVLSGRPCTIYTGRSTWMFKFGKSSEFFDNPLWQADYRKTLHAIPHWDASFWQYGTKGSVPGIKTKEVDKNRFFGTKEDLVRRFTLNPVEALAEIASRDFRESVADVASGVAKAARKAVNRVPGAGAVLEAAKAGFGAIRAATDLVTNF